jgi:hypothetical protein
MVVGRRLVPLVMLSAVCLALLGATRSAEAGSYIVYLHGRSMSGWPSNALLGAPAGWSHVPMSFNGSASLGDSAIRSSVSDTIASYCGSGNQCIIVCYSAGCARMLDAFQLLKNQGRYPGGILWSEAAASAAGGSELAAFSTKWWVKLLAAIFNLEGAAAIDNDIQPNVMRNGAYASIQNQATAPVYHLAGSQNICVTKRILFIKVKLCGNSRLPGDLGDGVVPVHSAGGYADTAAHASTNDGGPKYVFRAYEQTPLYAADHISILSPLVSAGSLRLAVGKNVTCSPVPGVSPAVPDASIVYEDADGAFTEESSPLTLLAMCGNNMWNGAPPLYATCYSVAGCCTSFSDGNAGGCSCGETLCRQAKVAYRSYYTTTDCTGTEYADGSTYSGFGSYNGLGMVGETTTSVTVYSARTGFSGSCQRLIHRQSWGNNRFCYQDSETSKTLTMARRIYRPTAAPPPPAGSIGGLIVSSVNYPGMCP